MWKVGVTFMKLVHTVKLGYNELGYNEHPVVKNKKYFLVGLGKFYLKFSRFFTCFVQISNVKE